MDNWITLSTLSGDSGTTIVTITAATQQELVERATSFTVKTNYTNLQQVVEVEQLIYLGLRFNITNGGNIYWKGNAKTIQYSKNGGEWVTITSSSSGVDIPVQSGDILFFKGDNDVYQYSSFSASTGTNFKVSGNIMSLIDSTDYENLTTLSSAYTFYGLFQNCSGLTDASNLELPATTLTSNCYQQMFNGCSGLTKAPTLPATTLASRCYDNMFAYCTSLTGVPALPATNLSGASYCYGQMFQGCTSLTGVTSDLLPATTLASGCYQSMFKYCSNLTQAPELPATNLVGSCYNQMFNGCGLTTAPELPATTLAASCYNQMFRDCSSLQEAPTLPAPTLVNYCYNGMFSGCSILNLIKCMATDISASNCTTNWVANVAPTGTFYKDDEMEDWLIDNVNGIPIGWTVDIVRPYLAFDILSNGYVNWRKYRYNSPTVTIEYRINEGSWICVTNSDASDYHIPVVSGDVVEFRGDNATYGSTGDLGYNTFSGTTCLFNARGNIMSLIKSTNFKYLTTFESASTFTFLFQKCTGLTDASELLLPATGLTEGCYSNMFADCSNLTGVPELPATTLAPYCYWGMFWGCTSLATLPELPATTLADYCYGTMFGACTSLTGIPSNYLPVTAITEGCYYEMFNACYGLTTVPYNLLPATTLMHQCYAGMFWDCTGLTAAPELPATTLVTYCYSNMFDNCISLRYIKCLATDISANRSTFRWVYSVPYSVGTFVKAASMSDWTTGVDGIPNGWTVQDA